MARSKSTTENQPVEVTENASVAADAEKKESKSTRATLLSVVTDSDGNTETFVISPLPSPSFRGDSPVSAAQYLATQFDYIRAEPHRKVRFVRFFLTDMLCVHVMIKWSGSQCPQCGIVRTDDTLTDWCKCSETDRTGKRSGCGYWRDHPHTETKSRGTVDLDAVRSVFG